MTTNAHYFEKCRNENAGMVEIQAGDGVRRKGLAVTSLDALMAQERLFSLTGHFSPIFRQLRSSWLLKQYD